MLLILIAQAWVPKRMQTDQRLAETVEFMEAHYNEKLRLESLARRAGMSENQFLRRFRRAFDTSPLQYLLDLRMKHACALLEESDLSIDQIASSTGFYDSNYFLDFTYSCKTDAGWIVRYHGSVEPNIKLYLETFGKEILNDLERICIQAIAYKKDKAFKQKNPISVEHRIDTVKFYKLHSFRENDYFDEEALIFPIVHNDVPERSFAIDPVEIENAIKQKKDSEKPERQAIKKRHRPANEPLEIDLHINALLDTTAGMSNSDMLQYQLQKVREILDEHKKEKGKKVIFIHGKGDGVLRNALINELKTKYKTFYYQDASFREYGYGATQVTIR